MPKPYPPEVRRRALDLVASGRSVAQVAASLGMSESCLHGWRTQQLIEAGVAPRSAKAVESAALRAAEARIVELENEVRILRKAAAAVEQVVPPKVRFALAAELAAEGVPVKQACLILGVSRSGFYDAKNRPPSARAIRQAWLTDQITAVFEAPRQTYGAPRVRAELVLGQGLVVSRKTVAVLMRRAGLAGLPLRRAAKKVPSSVTVSDLVARDFHRDGPNELWVTDITEHPTREGKVFCCVVLDVFSRRVVGWAIDSRARAELATSALGMAIESRSSGDGQIPGGIIHADHGTQFTSWTFTERAHRAGLLPSLGTVGDAYDNAVAEAFWGRMQTELLNRQRWNTRVELANAIFEYIEGFCNRRRRHSALHWQTPLQFETATHQPTANS
ncbi:IS3 family transposase [Pseudofrankia inefficax]|uniref:Integrase catalytic region n=1 Tax=Pseudofrankia inefficax (strain DSM 45817 / CECT 9037 / DDB 130130 / EuI1c) TaxID=298654 RepID=E3J779_PSEI1|nr:IS3 family transposase [Pseudofrankia inefficax]ADP84443.1 Integrase catalytic region [Pseudofrankia inefficax]